MPTQDTLAKSIEYVSTRTVRPTLKATRPDGSEVFLHSRFDPAKQAAVFAEKNIPKNAKAVIVLGVGLGYHLRAIRHAHPSLAVLAVELDESLVENFQTQGQGFGKSLNISVVCGTDKKVWEQKLGHFIDHFGDSALFCVRHAPCVSLCPELYREFERTLCYLLVLKAKNQLEANQDASIALDLLESAQGICPEDYAVHYFMGRALIALGRYEQAQACWEQAARLCSDPAPRQQVLFDLGRFYELYKADQPELAKLALEQVVSLSPESDKAHSALEILGRIYISPRLKRVVLKTPAIMQIEPTNACNLKCVMCPRNNMKRPVGFMDPALFEHIIVQGRKNSILRLIKLYFMGEPALHKDLVELVRIARRHGVPAVGFQSNGMCLTEELSRELLGLGVNDFGISFEKSTKGEYGQVRCGSDYETVRTNVENLVRVRNSMGVPTRIMLTAVDMGESEEQKQAFRADWGRIVDYVSFIDYSPHEHTSIIAPDGKTVKSVKRLKVSSVCREPFEKMVVLYNGDVVPCCVDYDGACVAGNLARDSVEDVWTGPVLTSLREKIINQRYDDQALCRSCPLCFEGMAKAQGCSL